MTRSKFGNVQTECEGFLFDSAREAQRWQYLKLLEHAGAIDELRRQVRYDLVVNGVKISHYTADMVYRDEKGNEIVEDVKSEATRKLRDYVMRKKLMKACLGITIQEVS